MSDPRPPYLGPNAGELNMIEYRQCQILEALHQRVQSVRDLLRDLDSALQDQNVGEVSTIAHRISVVTIAIRILCREDKTLGWLNNHTTRATAALLMGKPDIPE